MNELRPPRRSNVELPAEREADESEVTHEVTDDTHEYGQPPHVDFLEIAMRAVEAGVFARDTEAIQLNAGTGNGSEFSFPETMLEIPYNNGPFQIQRWEIDVPQALVDQFRRNFATANRLLLPHRQVMLYFHERFTAEDTFSSEGMREALSEYRPHVRSRTTLPEEWSFRTEGVDRTSKKRDLFTEQESLAALELARDEPAVMLAIVGYQGTIQDYLQNLGGAFVELASHPESRITQRDLENYQKFASAWNTSNFIDELMPAIAIHLTNARRANPEAARGSLLTRELFQSAADFIISNGAFRHFVDVPAHIALDSRDRVDKFLCPAVGAVRQQLLDGSLLQNIHAVTSAKIREDDPAASSLAATIHLRAKQTLDQHEERRIWQEQQAKEAAKLTIEVATEGRSWAEITGEAIGRALDKRKPAIFTFDGRSYFLTPNAIESGLSFHEEKQPGDQELEPQVGNWLYKVLEMAIARAVQTGRPAFFSFNGNPWRVKPEEVEALLHSAMSE